MKKKIVLIASTLLVVACGFVSVQAAEKQMKILMVVPPVEIEDSEYNASRTLFDQKGALVKVASTTKKLVTGSSLEIKPDLLISKAKSSDYDAIVLIGGMGIFEHIFGNQDLQKLVKSMYSEGKYICAICGTPVVLAESGILKDVEATVYRDDNLIKKLQDSGAKYIDNEVVVSGKIVTGNGPRAASAFAKAVCETIGL